MCIKSESIYFRALEPSDIEILYNSENDSLNWKVSNTLTPYSKQILELYLSCSHQDIYTNKQLRLMICLNNNHTAIGTIDLFDFEPTHLRVGIGILIFSSYRKMGYGKEAIKLAKKYTKETLFMNQIFCNISSLNKESIKLFENLGFNKTGVKKQWNQVSKNIFEDEIMYQFIF